MSAKGRTRIPVRVGRDDMRMDVDDRDVHRYFAYFLNIPVDTSAAYTLPFASAPTPSAPLLLFFSGSGAMYGINAVTLPSFTLPMRMPRVKPGFCLLFDCESVTYRMSLRSMNTPLGRPNCFHWSRNFPS